MVLLLANEDGDWTVLEKDDMAQYGLVGDGRAGALTRADVDGDGVEELLVADRNYIRALRFARNGDTPGWQVVSQTNAEDSDAELVALARTPDGLVAADRTTDQLLLFTDDGDGLQQVDTVDLPGIETRLLAAAPLAGHDGASILAAGDEAMAVVTHSGDRAVLKEAGTWRSAMEDHAPHEFGVGDVNADGHMDLLALDAGEQMLEILTFTQSGELLHATGFPVFESRTFSGGEGRQLQPRAAWVADINNDGRDDVVLLVHDRILIYPQ